MKRALFLIQLVFLLLFLRNSELAAQQVAIKANVLKYATATLYLEPEVIVGPKSTLSLGVSYNPWTFRNNKKWRQLRVQPEYRYWMVRPFGGHFLGFHGSYTRFNIGNLTLPFGWMSDLNHHRVQGNDWSFGVGYGYHWMLTSRWRIEAEVGLGFSFADYDRYECQKCGTRIDRNYAFHFLPTKLAVSFIYVIH